MEIDNGRPPCESQLLYATCKYHLYPKIRFPMNSEGKMSPCDDIRKLMPPKRNHRHKQLWMNSEECCLWLEVTSWFAQPGEFSERRFKISSHAHRERTSWEVRDCDKKEGIAGNRNTWGNMANTSPASVIAPSTRTVIIGVDDSCFSEYAFNCEYN